MWGSTTSALDRPADDPSPVAKAQRNFAWPPKIGAGSPACFYVSMNKIACKPREQTTALATLFKLRDLGNTLIVVEARTRTRFSRC